MLLRDFKQQGLSQRVAVGTQVSPKEVVSGTQKGHAAKITSVLPLRPHQRPDFTLSHAVHSRQRPSRRRRKRKRTHPPRAARPRRVPAAPAPGLCAGALSPCPPTLAYAFPPSSLHRVPAQQGAVVLCSGHTCLLFDLIACIPVTLTFLWSSKSMKASVPSGHLQALFPLSGKMFACLAPLTILG